MSFQQQNFSRQGNFFQDIPATKIIIGVWILSFLTGALGIPFPNEFLGFDPNKIPNLITGIVTHPLYMGFSPYGVLIGGYMLYLFGGSLERAWGARRYLLFLAGASASILVGWQIGVAIISLLRGLPVMLQPFSSIWLFFSAVIVAWCWLNPEETILLFFVLPIKARWLIWITVFLDFFYYGFAVTGSSFLLPIMGIFTLSGVGFAYLFVWYQRTWAWIPRKRRSKSSRNIIQHPSGTFMGRLMRPYREWQRRRRVANLSKTIRFDD